MYVFSRMLMENKNMPSLAWLLYYYYTVYSIILYICRVECRVECNNLSMHTTDDYISSIEQFQNMFII